MKRYIWALAVVSAICASCVKQDLDMPSGVVDGRVALRYTAEDDWSSDAIVSNGETRASGMTSTTEANIQDVWIFQFDGTATSSVLVAPPIYLTGTDITAVPLVNDGVVTACRVVVVANTHDANYQWNVTAASAATAGTPYSQLIAKVATIATEGDLYAGNSLLMVGQGDIPNIATSNTLTIPMRHSVARVEITVTCAVGSNIQVDAAQLCGVPTKFDLFSGLQAGPSPQLMTPKTAPYPAVGECKYVDYAPYSGTEGLPVTAGGGAKTLYWYTPQNLQGTIINTNVKFKNLYAPKQATYIKLYGKSTVDNTQVVYTFYPGENLTDNFNLKPNGNYKMVITINGKNDAVIDSRIDDQSVISFANKMANCYILNPPTANAVVKYRVYPTQVDLFWGPRYQNVPANMLTTPATENTPWTVDVLWMDESGLVVAAAGSADRIKISKATGNGVNDYFEITVPQKSLMGSFVVYLYKTSDAAKTPLWSWHMWVTDYNPDVSKLVPATGRYTYSVTGGEVDRFENAYWNASTWIDAYNAYSCQGMYANSFMMDRNIGQRSSYPEQCGSAPTATNNKGYFYYQWGRKDPFPAPTVLLYNIAGTAVTMNSIAGGNATTITLGDGVKNPKTYYTGSRSYDTWVGANFDSGFGSNSSTYNNTQGYMSYLWHDQNILYSMQTTLSQRDVLLSRSLYDPCPYGWKLPAGCNYTFTGFQASGGTTGNVCNPDRGLDWTKDGRTGLRYWPSYNVNGSYPVEGQIYFPTTGYYSMSTNMASSPSLTVPTTMTCIWGNVPYWYTSSTGLTYFWQIGTGLLYSSGGANTFVVSTSTQCYKAEAYPARCVSDN